MNFYKKNLSASIRMSLLLSTTFLVHLMVTPLAYNQNINPIPLKHINPFTQYNQVLITNDLNGYELLSRIEINPVISRNLRDFQKLLKRVLSASVLPFITFVILLIYTINYLKKKQRRRSLIASYLGGHAPPEMLY